MSEKERICGTYMGREFCIELWKPRPYQKEAVERWLRTKFGAVKLPTGAGKTLVALWAWAKLGFPKMVIVVPTNALKQNHVHELEKIGVPPEFITTEPRRKPGLVAIITYQLLTTRPEVFRKLISEGYKFWVFDESHHTAAEKFFERVFMPMYQNLKGRIYVLGLSATPFGSGAHTEEVREFLPLVYARTYGQIKEYLAPIELYLVATPLPPKLEEEYEEINREYHKLYHELAMRYGNGYTVPFHVLQRHMDDRTVQKFFKLFNAKRDILNYVKNKDRAVAGILQAFPDERAMLFSERQNQLIKLCYDLYHEYGITAVPFVQKTVPNKKKEKEILEKFREGKIRVLGIVRKGEEGVNFPDVSIGIIISTAKNDRAIIQRVGRIVRPRPGKIARIFFLYVPGTEEEELAAKVAKMLPAREIYWISMNDIQKLAEREAETNEASRKSMAFEYLAKVKNALLKLIKENEEKLAKLRKQAEEYSKKYGIAGWGMVGKQMKKLKGEIEWARKMLKAIPYMQSYLADELSEEDLRKHLARLGVTEKDIVAVAGEYAELIPKPYRLINEKGQMRWAT